MFPDFSSHATDTRHVIQPLALCVKGVGAKRKICIVSDCSQNADLSVQTLVDGFAGEGWQVTVFDLAIAGQPDQSPTRAAYVRLAGLFMEKNWYIQVQSLGCYHWLRDQAFDLVVFKDSFAAGFYSLSARRLGLAFHAVSFVVLMGNSHAYDLYGRKRFPAGRHDLEFDFMERQTAAKADGVIFTHVALAEWVQAAGWILPDACGVLSDEETAPRITCGAWLQPLLKSAPIPPPALTEPVFISVCVATFNQAKLLHEALASLEKQTYPHFEVIVMDDGSTSPDVDGVRDAWHDLFKRRGWTWLKQDNAGPSAARNRAAQQAVGAYLLFMDDDNIAFPDELERFALAAQRNPAIVACIIGMHADSIMAFPPTLQLPEREGTGTRPVGWTPLGGDLALSVYINVLGDTNSLFRRDVFRQLGGFHCNDRANFEDFELLTRALIAGFTIDVLPEVLMLYRRTGMSRSMDANIFEGHLNSLRVLAELLPPALRPLLLTLRHEWYARHCLRRENPPRETGIP